MLRAYTTSGFSSSAYLSQGAAIAYNSNRATYINNVVSNGKISQSSANIILQGLATYLEQLGSVFEDADPLSVSAVEQQYSSIAVSTVTNVDNIDKATTAEIIITMPDDMDSIVTSIEGGSVTGAIDSSGNPSRTPVTLETAITSTYDNKFTYLASTGSLSTFAQMSSIAYTPLSVVSDVFLSTPNIADNVLRENASDNPDYKNTTTQIVVGGVMPGNDGNDVPATAAKLIHPSGLAIADNLLYIADKADNSIRAVSLISGRIVKIAGNEDQSTLDSEKISANLTFPSDELLIFREERGESGDPDTGKAGVIRGLNDADRTTQITEGSTNYRFGSIPTYRVSRCLDAQGEENVPALKTKIIFNRLSNAALFPDDAERTAARIKQGDETTDFTNYKLSPAAIAANTDGTIIFCEPGGSRIREIPRNAIY